MDLPSPALATALRPLSSLYGWAMTCRAQLYAAGRLKSCRAPAPVISVGNLTVGGTGKTPVVRLLAEHLLAMGRRPAILSRGYGGRRSRMPRRVPGDRRGQFAAEYGDEPCFLAASLPSVPVYVGTRRAASARRAMEVDGADVLVLDDGFQHLPMARDLNLCLLGPDLLPESLRVLPSGPLREPREALGRADLIWVNADADAQLGAVDEQWPTLPTGAPEAWVGAVREPAGLVRFGPEGGRTPVPDAELAGKRVLALSGIARPERFAGTVRQYGAEPVSLRAFPDHHRFTPGELAGVFQEAVLADVHAVVTTEKDATRLRDLVALGWVLPESMPVYVVDIRLRIARGGEVLEAMLRRVLES